EPGIYTVTEDTSKNPAGMSLIGQNGIQIEVTANNTATIPTAEFTNNRTEKISIPVKKIWIGPAAESATVELLADGVKVAEAVLSKSNGWMYTFEDLDQYNNGVEINYTLREVGINGYTAEITGEKTGFTVTNTNTETVKIQVEKRWVGSVGQPVTVKLVADGIVVRNATLSRGNNWKYMFSDLPKYDSADGHEILYTVYEESIPGYKSTITGNAKNGFVVTNTETPPDTPKTGDLTNRSLYLWAMILSGFGIIGILVSEKKKIRLKK
ncbi:MAG: Cna B-type domain-containing protein, partial [Clostridia bacterium]|nr:Cna B-type domain-containing protein [Clostridia bacterium]